MGRPITNRSNNWHDSWYPRMEIAAWQVLEACDQPVLASPSDLVNEAWIRYIRYQPAEENAFKWKFVKSAMWDALKKMVQANHLEDLEYAREE